MAGFSYGTRAGTFGTKRRRKVVPQMRNSYNPATTKAGGAFASKTPPKPSYALAQNDLLTRDPYRLGKGGLTKDRSKSLSQGGYRKNAQYYSRDFMRHGNWAPGEKYTDQQLNRRAGPHAAR